MKQSKPRLTGKHAATSALIAFGLALSLLPAPLRAQDVTATINGIITDPQDKVVPNVAVIATDLDRQTTWPTQTNGEGFYNLSRLPVGRYEVRVTAPGFSVAVQSPVELQLNQVAVVNIKLQVGQNTNVVEVAGEASLLKTQSTEVSTVIDARANVNLPLASRNYLQLTLLTPGAVTPNPSGSGSFTSGQTTGQNERPMINGNRFTANDYILDGMDNNQMSDNFVAYSPQPDAIQEFNLIAQNAPADFGNYMGGIISVMTKSGTNAFHGSVFEFFRNDVLNANQWSNNLSGIARPKLRWNQFGAAVGGPVIKNKLFFFADYQGERFDTPVSGTAFSVMTAKERTGDFSQLSTVLKNPFTNVPFAGNQIPIQLQSIAALKIINSPYYPLPLNNNLTSNQINFSHTYTNADQGDGRMDWAINDKNHVFGRFSESNTINPTTNSYALAYNSYSNAKAWNSVIDYTSVLSSNLVNDARIGVGYINIDSGTDTNSIDVSQFGISGLPSSILPAMMFSSNSSVTGVRGSRTVFGSKNSRTEYADTVIQYQDVLSWTRGKQNIRFGFQGWRLRMNGLFPGNAGYAGSFEFNGRYSGRAESDFLLGLPDQVQVGQPGPIWGQRGNILGAFIQDDWKVSDRLTVNLGLRYENHSPWYEAHDRQLNFNPATGALELPGQNGNSRALYDAYNGIGNYQPRVGLAYSLFEKTVVRAGYSLSSFMEGTGQGLRLPQNPPYSIESVANYNSLALPTTTLGQGFTPISSSNPCTIAGMQSGSSACYSGSLLLSWDPHVMPALSSQWNFTIQQQLARTVTLQVGYVGQSAHHLAAPKNLSQLYLNADGSLSPSRFFTQNQNLITALSALPLATYSDANSNYNALQVSLNGRLNHGMSYQLSYTWSHCLTDATGFFGESGSGQQSASQDAWYQNVYNTKADYGSCYFNVKNNVTGYLIYDLPVGHGRAYGSNLGKVANAVVGDWRVSVMPSFRGGFPLTLGANDVSGTNSFGSRPNCIAPANVLGKTQATGSAGPGYQWFSAASYAQPTSGFGTCGVGTVYGPGLQNVDLGISKSFIVHADQNLEFRTEFLNAFNHVILNAPDTNIGPTLGVINSSQGARNIQFALKYNF